MSTSSVNFSWDFYYGLHFVCYIRCRLCFSFRVTFMADFISVCFVTAATFIPAFIQWLFPLKIARYIPDFLSSATPSANYIKGIIVSWHLHVSFFFICCPHNEVIRCRFHFSFSLHHWLISVATLISDFVTYLLLAQKFVFRLLHHRSPFNCYLNKNFQCNCYLHQRFCWSCFLHAIFHFGLLLPMQMLFCC